MYLHVSCSEMDNTSAGKTEIAKAEVASRKSLTDESIQNNLMEMVSGPGVTPSDTEMTSIAVDDPKDETKFKSSKKVISESMLPELFLKSLLSGSVRNPVFIMKTVLITV